MRHFSEEREKRRELALVLVEAAEGYGSGVVLEAVELAFRYRANRALTRKDGVYDLGRDYRTISDRIKGLRTRFDQGKEL